MLLILFGFNHLHSRTRDNIHLQMYIMEAFMIVAKWGNSLAVRLPKQLVEELGLAEGDDLTLIKAKGQQLEVARLNHKAEFLKEMETMRWTSPKGWTFDRDEANQR
jgi:antitoxin MazE